MISRAQTPLRVSHDDAIRLTQDIYGLKVSARSLPGEYDHNFHVTTADGRAFVLKIMHVDRERELVDLQCQALRHLADRAPEIVLPRVQLTRKGEAYARAAVMNGH